MAQATPFYEIGTIVVLPTNKTDQDLTSTEELIRSTLHLNQEQVQTSWHCIKDSVVLREYGEFPSKITVSVFREKNHNYKHDFKSTVQFDIVRLNLAILFLHVE